MVPAQQTAIAAAVRAGGLIRYGVLLEQSEFDQRMLWIRPEIQQMLNSRRIDPDQQARIAATLKRFVVGGRFNVVTAACTNREVSALGDIRELKGENPPVIEMRFKPPKDHLRIFGRFICEDGLVLTTYGMKSFHGNTGVKPLSIPQERKRCDAVFKSLKLDLGLIPTRIEACLSSNCEFY
jgi:hypothetical protein